MRLQNAENLTYLAASLNRTKTKAFQFDVAKPPDRLQDLCAQTRVTGSFALPALAPHSHFPHLPLSRWYT